MMGLTTAMAIASGITSPVFTGLGLLAGSWLSRRSAMKTALAAETEAEASRKEATTADWKAFSDALAARLGAVESRSTANETRIEAAETRAVAAEIRATKAEGLYTAAIQYLRRVAAWLTEKYPSDRLPEHPPELDQDLRMPWT